jgi:SAM-dependent methyltransferase
MNMQKIFLRLFCHKPLDIAYWRQRATQSGDMAVLWANPTYNTLVDMDQWKLIERYMPQRRESVLDLCCGTGRLSARLASCFSRYVGLDLGNMVVEARKRNPLLADLFYESTVQQYDFGNERFDFILSVAGLSCGCSREELPQIMERIADGVRSRGRFMMIDPFHRSNLLARTCKIGAREVVRIARRSGFELEYWSGLCLFPSRPFLTELAWFHRRPGLTRRCYRAGGVLLKLAPTLLCDYSVIVLTKP